MGDIKRNRRLFTKPRKLYDKPRIEQEDILVLKYGLKNKREIWKADSKVSEMRKRAKLLIPQSKEDKEIFFNKLNKMGLSVSTIADVLALTKEDLLERRLQTAVFKKGLCKTPSQARQLIVHKHVYVDGKIVNSPSFILSNELTNKLTLKPAKVKAKKIVSESETSSNKIPTESEIVEETEK